MTKKNKLRKPRKAKEVVPEMSAGAVIGDTASFASTGAALGSIIPGVGNVVGGVVGGAVGLTKGLFDHFKEKKAERKEEVANALIAKNMGAVQASAGSSINNFRDPWVAANGGIVPGGQVVELKGTETSLDPNDKSLARFDLPKKHPNLSRVPLKEGAVVFPDTMEIPAGSPMRKYGKYFAEASVAIDNERSKAQKVLDSKTSTPIARRTAERNIYNADRKYGELTGTLLSEHNRLGVSSNGQGTGVPQADLGAIIKGATKFLGSDAGKTLLNTAGSLAPVFSNLGQASRPVEKLNAANFQNPMAYDALSTMRGRQVDVQPMLTNTAESAAIAEANLRGSGAGAGAYRAGVTGIQNARMKANSAVLNQADIQNNAYLGDYAQMQVGVGNQMADRSLMISDLNARNEAAGRNYNAAAMGQLGQFSQIQQQMLGQKQRDQMLMPMYQSWLEQMTGKKPTGFTAPTSNIQMPSFSQAAPGLAGAPKSLPTYLVDPSYANQMAGR